MPSFATIESVSGMEAASIKEMENYVSNALDQDTGTITAFRVLHMYLERLSVDFQVFQLLIHPLLLSGIPHHCVLLNTGTINLK